jgi:hypothetical protein
MAKNSNRRTFGALEAHKHPKTGKVTSWRARYTGPDTGRHGRSFIDRMMAETRLPPNADSGSCRTALDHNDLSDASDWCQRRLVE